MSLTDFLTEYREAVEDEKERQQKQQRSAGSHRSYKPKKRHR